MNIACSNGNFLLVKEVFIYYEMGLDRHYLHCFKFLLYSNGPHEFIPSLDFTACFIFIYCHHRTMLYNATPLQRVLTTTLTITEFI